MTETTLDRLMTSAAAGGTACEIGVAYDQALSEVRVVNELNHTFRQGFLGLGIVVYFETWCNLVDQVPIYAFLLERHSELGAGAGKTAKVYFDAISDLLVLFQEIVDEFLCIRCDLYHIDHFLIVDTV